MRRERPPARPRKEQESPSGDALATLQRIYRDPSIPIGVRVKAAALAVEYERVPLAPVPASIPVSISPMETLRRYSAGDPAITDMMATAAMALVPYWRI